MKIQESILTKFENITSIKIDNMGIVNTVDWTKFDFYILCMY